MFNKYIANPFLKSNCISFYVSVFYELFYIALQCKKEEKFILKKCICNNVSFINRIAELKNYILATIKKKKNKEKKCPYVQNK